MKVITDDVLVGIVKALRKEFDDKLAAMEQRVLEAERTRYAGAWQRSASYRAGQFVTHKGSMWCCLKDALRGSQPGTCDEWQLAVKAGKDAR